MSFDEQAFAFDCGGEVLCGVVHASGAARRGLLVVVGGPQYRVGSHRQFVLLARAVSRAGIPVMRFDYRGMGDSSGTSRGFETIADDIEAAADAFASRAGVDEVVLWGLCDGASALCLHAHRVPRVVGMVLVNPWVRTEAGEARARLRSYYVSRLRSAGLWRKLVRGEINFGASLRSLGHSIRSATGVGNSSVIETGLPDRMVDGLERFDGRLLLVLSGDDLTAQEFRDCSAGHARWRRALERADTREIPDADHTFSRRRWSDQVADWTAEWIRSW